MSVHSDTVLYTFMMKLNCYKTTLLLTNNMQNSKADKGL